MAINRHIFRQYDIRGIVEEDLTGDVPERIGRAFASELRERHGRDAPLQIAVGQDNRPSSPELADAVIRGIRAAGVDAVDVGTVPTPVLYYATVRFETDAGIQITGSHNPAEYNGFKLLADGQALYGDAILALRDRVERDEYTEGDGARSTEDALGEYIQEVGRAFSITRPLTAVVDCGNGTGSLAAEELLNATGAEILPLYCESDGTFPNHHPDPTVDENLEDLIARVRAEDADVGIAFDGDADRIGVVDENGRIVRGDLLLLLFGLDILRRGGAGAKMIFDVKCSQAVAEVFAAEGGEPIMWKTGHSLIKRKMRQEDAPIAGELSGHICFADNNDFDDALYAACRLIDLLARSDEPLSTLIDRLPDYLSTPEIRIEVPEDRKFELVDRAIAHFRRDHDVIDVDGVRVLFGDGWGLLRASNTQPVLVLRFEARTADRLGEIRGTFEDWLGEQGVST